MEEVLLRVYLEFWQDVNVESVCLTPLGVSPVHVVAARKDHLRDTTTVLEKFRGQF